MNQKRAREEYEPQGDRRKKVLVISLSNLSRDPRVLRQIDRLHVSFTVHTAAIGASGLESRFFFLGFKKDGSEVAEWIKFWRLLHKRAYDGVRRLLLGIDRLMHLPKLKEWVLLCNPNYIDFIRAVSGTDYSIVVANDLPALSLAMKVRGKARLLFDAHEYSAGQSSDSHWLAIEKPYIDYLLKKYISSVDAMVTVGEYIAEMYAKDHQIPKPAVIMNAPDFRILTAKHRFDGRVKIVHHGIAVRQRAIDVMIRAVELTSARFSLDLYLVKGDEEYYREIQEACLKCDRINLNEPVGMRELPEMLNEFDIGLYILPPTCNNQLYALPNKLFEYIQARLAIAIGPSPEMERIVKTYNLGVVARDFTSEAMADVLERIKPEELASYKENSNKAARELSGGPQGDAFMAIIDRLSLG